MCNLELEFGNEQPLGKFLMFVESEVGGFVASFFLEDVSEIEIR
jgi:hypothetical protein